MKTRALGYLLMVAAAGVYAVGCGSSSPKTGTGGAGMDAGTGGKGTGGSAGAGMGGMGTGGMGTGGKTDAGPDTKTDTGTGTDVATDMATDMAADGQTAPTWTQVFAILSNVTTPTADTAPGCIHCHDGVIPDGGQNRLPHNMNLADKTAAYNMLVGVDSIRCAGSDAGGDASAALKRVLANNAAQSVLYQKLNQGVNPTQLACDGVAMPLNVLVPADGGGTDAGDGGLDAGFVQSTHYAITAAQLATIMGWINAGALNN